MNKTCFVIMPIGKQEFNGQIISQAHLKEKYTFLIKEALLKADSTLDVIRADEVGIPGGVSSDILTRIMKSDYVIADITYPNANVFYELGLRHASRIGTILIKEKDSPSPPFDIYDLRYIPYDNSIHGLHALSEEIKKHFQWIDNNKNYPDNRFLELVKSYNHPYPVFNSRMYPEQIEQAIQEQLFSRNFYKENVLFNIVVNEILDQEILLTTELSYYVTNRTNDRHHWKMQKKFKYRESEVLEVKYNDNLLDTKGLDFQNARGITVPQLIQPGEKAKAYFKVREKYRKKDFELYTSYHPATDLKLVINNPFKELIFDFEVFYFSNVFPVVNDSKMEIVFEKGILPHQGVRLNWRIKNDEL